jgi:hypothetical protein
MIANPLERNYMWTRGASLPRWVALASISEYNTNIFACMANAIMLSRHQDKIRIISDTRTTYSLLLLTHELRKPSNRLHKLVSIPVSVVSYAQYPQTLAPAANAFDFA